MIKKKIPSKNPKYEHIRSVNLRATSNDAEYLSNIICWPLHAATVRTFIIHSSTIDVDLPLASICLNVMRSTI